MNGAMLPTASLKSSITGVLSRGGGGGFCSSPGSPRMSFGMEPCRRRNHGIQHTMSENDVVAAGGRIGGIVSRSFSSASIQEDKEDRLSIGHERMVHEVWSEVMGFHGGGRGDGFSNGGGYARSGSGGNKSRKLGDYYEKMLRMNPGDPLFLRNYARYLHEVEGNTVRAEEYYGRAVLADPGDGEVLSMYAKLIWEAWGDGERAKCYHDRAVSTSLDNCVVLGSYAQFLWESDQGDD